jgi:hypothetical protein
MLGRLFCWAMNARRLLTRDSPTASATLSSPSAERGNLTDENTI